jgi:REP element-mobilizing transposase RayT
MMKNKTDYSANFYENGIFHVYNRTNNKELLFKSTDNKLYFLKQFQKYLHLHPFLDTFCWNLLPNHFHFLVRIKSTEEIKNYLKTLPSQSLKPVEKKYLADNITTELLLELEWKRFFNSYAMAFNKQHKRKGNLFQRPFKRIEVLRESQFTQAVIYIHANAQHHKLCSDFTEHQWSSWHSILSDKSTHLKREEILEWFGGRQQFINAHKSTSDYYYNYDISIEEDE